MLGEFAFTLKPQLSVQSALEAAEAVICKDAGTRALELWNARDIRWRERHAYVMKAFTSQRIIFGQVVMRTPVVHVSMPYRVHEIFKILSDTEDKRWYDPAKKSQKTQVDRPGRAPARSVRLQDGLAHGERVRSSRSGSSPTSPS